MSIALDIIEAMIDETAETARKVSITDEAYGSFDRLGMGIGVGIRLAILQEVKTNITKAEMKELEKLNRIKAAHDAAAKVSYPEVKEPGWYTG